MSFAALIARVFLVLSILVGALFVPSVAAEPPGEARGTVAPLGDHGLCIDDYCIQDEFTFLIGGIGPSNHTGIEIVVSFDGAVVGLGVAPLNQMRLELLIDHQVAASHVLGGSGDLAFLVPPSPDPDDLQVVHVRLRYEAGQPTDWILQWTRADA